MFRFKKTFSIRESPCRLASVSPIQSTPIKRIKLSFDHSEKIDTIATPPPTPAPVNKSESRLELLRNRKVSNDTVLEKLDAQLNEGFLDVQEIKASIVELEHRRFQLDDQLDMANRSLLMVRNLLNEIYNPGNELAQKAVELFTETKRNHQKAFEKLSFELNNRLESCEIAINKKMKELFHEIELHKRTLLTIECQKRHQLSQIEEEKVKEVEEETVKDDDCVVLDCFGPPDDNQNKNGVTSDATATCEDEEDDETDVDDDKEDGPFTPCQAQRPN